MRRKNSGVTLVELMITVGIVGILAAIAYPSYQSQVLRGGRADGKAELMEASQDLEKCFTRFGRYDDPGCVAFTDMTGGGFRTSERGRYRVTITASNRISYTLEAVPQNGQVTDTACLNLRLDQTGRRDRTGDSATVNECW